MSEVSEFEGRTLVVTGGTGALGTAVVKLLPSPGAVFRQQGVRVLHLPR